MSQKVSLSIIIPAYNEESHIRRCLEAIAAQTDAPDEVIVVDNNSTDNTVQIVKEFPFAKVVPERKQGRAYARDAGFEAATTDIIGRIDADTILPPGWVAYVRRFYASPQHENHCLTGGCYFENVRAGKFIGWAQGQIAFRMNRFIMGHYILFGSNMAIPKKFWEEVRPKLHYQNNIHEDLDLAIHVHDAGHEITYRTSLQVGITARRVFEERDELWENLLFWPNTLRLHHNRRWVMGWLGAAFLYAFAKIMWPVFKKR